MNLFDLIHVQSLDYDKLSDPFIVMFIDRTL